MDLERIVLALVKMINDVSQELDNNKFSLGVFIDLSKAFDTVHHNFLLKNVSLWYQRHCFTVVHQLLK